MPTPPSADNRLLRSGTGIEELRGVEATLTRGGTEHSKLAGNFSSYGAGRRGLQESVEDFHIETAFLRGGGRRVAHWIWASYPQCRGGEESFAGYCIRLLVTKLRRLYPP